MSCNLRPQIIILPGLCLGGQAVELPSKSPIEEIFYSFSVVNRMKVSDKIIYVMGQLSDPSIIIDKITFTGKTFMCRIGGGTLNTKTGIRFVLMTKENEVIEIVCVLPVMAKGNLVTEEGEKIVLGDTGPAGTITIGDVSTVSFDQPAAVTNIGIPSAAILNIDIPQGKEGVTPIILAGTTTTVSSGQDAKVTAVTSGATTQFNFEVPQGLKGDAGSRWYSGTTEPDETVGNEDERGVPRPGDMYLLLNSDGHNASTYILTNDNKWEGPLATVAGPQGAPGKDGTTPTIQVGEVDTLPADQPANVTAITTDSTTIFDFALPKGKQGDSYVNDGTTNLNIKSLTSDEDCIQSDGNGNFIVYQKKINEDGVVSLVAAFKITPDGSIVDKDNTQSILSTLDGKFSVDSGGNIYSKGGVFLDNKNIISGGEGTLKLQSLHVGQINNSGKSGTICLRDGKTTNLSDASISIKESSGEQGKIDSGIIQIKSKEVNVLGDLLFGVNGSKIKANGAAEISCIELGSNSTGVGYIDFHTTYLNDNGKANDYDVRLIVENTSGLTSSGMGKLIILGDVTATKSFNISGSSAIGNQLTVGKVFQSIGFLQFDQNTIFTDGKGKMSFYDQTNKKLVASISYNDGINVKDGAVLTLSNKTSDGTEKSARFRYTGTPTENIISIDSNDTSGATIACNRIRTSRVISKYNDNTYTRLCPVIYDAASAIGSDNGLPNTVTMGYVVACKNFTINGKIIQDTLLVRANKDYPTTLAGWDVIGLSTQSFNLEDLKSGALDLNVKSINSDSGKFTTDGQGNIVCGKIDTTMLAMRCLEVGNGKKPAYIDFHNNDDITNDYDARLMVGGNTGVDIGMGILGAYCSQFSIDGSLSSDKGKLKTDGLGI